MEGSEIMWNILWEPKNQDLSSLGLVQPVQVQKDNITLCNELINEWS